MTISPVVEMAETCIRCAYSAHILRAFFTKLGLFVSIRFPSHDLNF